MKIAAKVSLTALSALLLGAALTPVMAQEVTVLSSSVSDSLSTSAPQTSFDKADVLMSEGEEALIADPEVPDSVKEIVKRLNHATKDVTLEDLNSAREAVVKLDVLIDIEKRLNDLISLRKEREDTSDDLADAIPNSALPVAPSVASAYVPQVQSTHSIMPDTLPDIEVIRVMGASGHYAALIKDAEGSETQVRIGDKLTDGSKVKGISRKGVTIKNGKKIRTVKIKDVGAIFTGNK